MPPIQGWFRSRKPLSTRQRLEYYEDVYGEKNPDEDLQGVHILADESDTDPEILGGKGKRRARNKMKKQTIRNKIGSNGMSKLLGNTRARKTKTSNVVDKTNVVTIDDDSDDVDELFFADMQRYAQNVSESDGNDDVAPAGIQNQDQIDDSFLEEIKRYAQSSENIEADEEDEILKHINKRALRPSGPGVVDSLDMQQTRVDNNIAEQMEVPNDSAAVQVTEEPDDQAIIPSTEMPDYSAVVEAADDNNVLDEASTAIPRKHRSKRVRFENFTRAHSWDSSQGSNYAYTDDENQDDKRHAANNRISFGAVEHQDHQRDDISNDEFQNDEPAEDNNRQRQAYEENETQAEELTRTGSGTSDDSARDQSSSQPVELTSCTRSDQSEDEIVSLSVRQSSQSNRGQTSDAIDAFTSSNPHTKLDRKRRRKFGMFASQPIAADNEPVIDLTMDEPPRKQSLGNFLKRGREDESRDTPAQSKRGRYNLRSRSDIVRYSGGGIRGVQAGKASLKDLWFESDDELKEASNNRRETRSMSAKKKQKKIIPRHKAARKSAWAAMGLSMKEDRPRQHQMVQVVIPETDIDRSAYRFVAPPSPQAEGRKPGYDEFAGHEGWPKDQGQSLIILGNQSRFEKHDERSALAGKARKRLVAGKEIQVIEVESEGEDRIVSEPARFMLEMVLID